MPETQANKSQADGALHIDRHAKGSSPLGSATFVALRILDPILQYAILSPDYALGDRLVRLSGGTPLASESSAVSLGLSPWRLTLLGMSLLGSVKGIFYLVYVSEMKMPLVTGFVVGLFKAFSTTANSLLFCATATSAASTYAPDPSTGWHPILSIAWTVYVVGIGVETYAELQRRAFKKDRRNRRKAYTAGLFRLARHINYGGYTLWKAAVGLTAAGWWWSGLTLVWLMAEFRRRGIPGLDAYCQER
ncbi:hypothetical protein PHISCL_08884, partial [Aspergillus sclerotialis]